MKVCAETERVDVWNTSPEVFKARVVGVLSNLVKWKVPLLMAEGLEPGDLQCLLPTQVMGSMILGLLGSCCSDCSC